MTAIRTAIVDDEALSREGLQMMLAVNPEFEIVATCGDGREAISEIKETRPDLLLLDIQMPEISGFDVLRALPAEVLPVVVFVTAYDEYAIAAFEVHALDYLLKPVSEQRLAASLARAKRTIRERRMREHSRALLELMSDLAAGADSAQAKGLGAQNRLERIMVRDNKRIVFVRTRDILWIEGADYYVILHCEEKTHLYRESLKTLEEALDPGEFFRIHKSAIVSLGKIKEIRQEATGANHVLLISGEALPLSRRRKKALLELGAARFGLRS